MISGVAVSLPAAATIVNNNLQVTTHVTDTMSGRPAEGVAVKLFTENQSGTWTHVADRYGTIFREQRTPVTGKKWIDTSGCLSAICSFACHSVSAFRRHLKA